MLTQRAAKATQADALDGDHALVTKLEAHGPLPDADRALLALMLQDVRTFRTRHDVIGEGDTTDFVHLMVEGWSCRYSIVRDGGRQITAFLIPGDFCDAHITLLGEMDHSIATLGPARVAFIAKDVMEEVGRRPALTRALWWASLVDEGVLRAWIVNLGQRSAVQRVAHLTCELHARMAAVRLITGDGFALPLRQEDLADALGLTPVHINRVLRILREEGLMAFARQTVVVDDIARLRRAADFNDGYLHLIDEDARPATH